MSVVSVLVCNVGGVDCSRFRPEVKATDNGAARTRAAIHGWTSWERFGRRYDACPACTVTLREHGMATPAADGPVTTDQLLAVLAAPEPASAARRAPWRSLPAQHASHEHVAPQHPVQLLPDGVEVCAVCADGEHWLCRGCPCPVAAHVPLGVL